MKVSHQYNDHHSAYVLYYFHDSSGTNQNVGGLTQASTGYAAYEFDQELTYHDDLTFAANRLNQLNVRYERNLDRTVSNQQAQQIVVQGIAEFGGAQNDTYITENNPDVTDMVSWTLAKPIPQQLKFGLQITNTGRRILDDFTNRQGTYTFSSAAAYAAGTPASFSIQQGQDRFFTLYATPSAFIYDEIQASKRLTITPGARYDFQNTISNTRDGVEPRLSIAYLIDKKHALVARIGGGLFIRHMGANIGQDMARYQFAAERKLLLTTNICYPTCTAAQLAAPPPSLSNFAPAVHAPMQAYFSLSIERQLTKNSTVTLGYNGYRGWHALRAIDINAPLPPFTSLARSSPAICNTPGNTPTPTPSGPTSRRRTCITPTTSGAAATTISASASLSLAPSIPISRSPSASASMPIHRSPTPKPPAPTTTAPASSTPAHRASRATA
jgi:hypothetical protein